MKINPTIPEGCVPVHGFVPQETAQKIINGDLMFNNGLRNAQGKASFYSEQPVLELGTGTNEILFGLAIAAAAKAIPTIIDECIPRLFKLLDEKKKEINRNNSTQSQVKEAPQKPKHATILDLEEFRKASGI